MLALLMRFDRLIAASEARIAEQATRIAAAEAAGEDTSTLRRALSAFEAVLVEYRRAREVTEDLRQTIENGTRAKRPYRRST